MTLQIPSWYRLLTIFAFLFVLYAAACPPAFAAQPGNEEPSTTVEFGDLNLNTDAGRRELLGRLSKAADRVCRERVTSAHSPLDAFGYRRAYLSCYRDTLAAAVEKIHHEQVSALFAATSLQNTP
jgi:UrcA family protein